VNMGDSKSGESGVGGTGWGRGGSPGRGVLWCTNGGWGGEVNSGRTGGGRKRQYLHQKNSGIGNGGGNLRGWGWQVGTVVGERSVRGVKTQGKLGPIS